MTTETPKRVWRTPDSARRFTPKVKYVTGPKCKACKDSPAREGSAFCGEWCAASWAAAEGAAK